VIGVPLLVRLIRRSRRRPEEFILETLIRPYVNAEAYLLFEHGVQHEGHTQNVLLEVDSGERLTGRLVLRDLTDTSLNIAFRVATGKPLPRFHRGSLPRAAPFSIAGQSGVVAVDEPRHRGVDRPGRARCLELWQQAAIASLNVRPLFRTTPKGMATDEAIAYYLRQIRMEP
jgi:hypothetical protein